MPDLPALGRTLGQRFILEEQIGAGGMGTVYRARDVQTDRMVAIKVLQPHGTPQEAERFAREAQLLAGLQHPHIVAYIADGLDDAGQPYLAMEWLEGEDLAQCLRHRRLTLSECVALLLGASAGLAEGHQRGIVHRDLKPANLFLRGGNPANVMLLDYGIARRIRHGLALTRTGVVIGTPEYMAPEQARGGRDVGPPADIFSLGCVLYECLTGRPPFAGDHIAAILIKVLLEEAPSLELYRGEVPAALSELLKRMLRKEPQERFPDGMALHEALRRLELPVQRSSVFTSPTVLAAVALTPQEQQMFSVAIAISRASEQSPGTLISAEGDAELALHRSAQVAVRQLGARVELLGDGTLVATVLPSANAADQATLAARCGLLLRACLPDAEVAVATGRGLLRGHGPVGEVVERALALLKAGALAQAEAGPSVFLDELTENLLSGGFEIAHGEGPARLLREIDASTADDARKLLGQPTPCVGREQELGTLEAALASCIDDSMARAVGVVAPPGMGKSRLRFEFLHSSQQRYSQLVVLLGRGDMTNPGAPYGILGQALRRHCGIVGGEPLQQQQQQLRERLGRHLQPESAGRIISFVSELCGVPLPAAGHPSLQAARSDPRVMHDQVTQAFLEWLRAECQAAPVLLVLEDLHWGDAPTISLVALALRELDELPLFILTLARPEAQELFPAFFSASTLQALPLRPLNRRACERLALDVLQRVLGRAVDGEAVARIVAQSSGNPLFLEELIRAVAEGRNESLPETILAMLIGRLSQLDPAARQALRAASVFGETFPRGGMAALVGEDPASAALDSTLALLVRAELIERRREAQGAGQERYKFRQALVRDAAYSLLTAENRVLAHRLAGSYLEATGDAAPAVLADHARKSEDLERAAQFYVQAAGHALAKYDLDATSSFAAQALECGVQGEPYGLVQAMQAVACYLRMDLAAGADHAIIAVDGLRPGSLWWCKAIKVCIYSFFMIGRVEHMERLIGAFFAVTPDPDARESYVEAGAALCTCFQVGGLRRASESLLQRLTALAADFSDHDRGYLLYASGFQAVHIEQDPFRGVLDGQQAAAVFHSHGDHYGGALSLFCVGMAYYALGVLDASEAALRTARALAIAAQNTFYSTVIHLHLGFVLADQPIAAKQEEARSIGETFAPQPQLGPAVRGASHRILAQVHLAAGEVEAAAPFIQVALDAFTMMLPHYLDVVPLQIEVLLQGGSVSEARRFAETAVRLIDEQGGLGACELPVRLALARACFADEDASAGQCALDEALVQVERCAARITDPELRAAYLGRSTNRQILALARARQAGG